MSLTFVWKINGIVKRTFTSATVLADSFNLGAPVNGVSGDVVTVAVTPNDGIVDGTLVSGTATIAANHAPTATVVLSADLPSARDTLIATATKSDADADPVSLSFVWKVNGIVKRAFTSATVLIDSFNLGAPVTGVAGDVVTVEITPNDGTDDGTVMSDTATIAVNHAPTATVVLSADLPSARDTLIATVTKSDLDVDPVSLTFVWKVNGIVNRTFTSATALTDSFNLGAPVNGVSGDMITVEVTPTDGTEDGTLASDTATIAANHAPTATVVLDSHVPKMHGTLTATSTKSDLDLDPISLSFVWKVNGIVKRTFTSTTALADSFNLGAPVNGVGGDVVTVEVTPNDGFADGTPASDTATVAVNHPPTATVALSADLPSTRDTLIATATKSDLDADPVGLSFVWKVNGVVKRTFTSATALTDSFNLGVEGNGDGGDTVTVEVTPDDRIVSGVIACDAATVTNQAPTLSSVDRNVAKGSTLAFSATDFATRFHDADGGWLQKIRITSLPSLGTLQLAGVAVTLNQEIAASELDALTYTPISRGADSFGWNGSDGSLYADVAASVNVTVTKIAPTQVMVYCPNLEIHDGESLRGNVLVTIPNASGVLPTGTITLIDWGGTVLQTVAMVDGQASFSLAGLKRGPHQIDATYSGDASYKKLRTTAPLSVQVRAGNVVDILAVYTQAAARLASNGVNDAIAKAVAGTNLVLDNNGLNVSLNLVGVVATSYTESGAYRTDLPRLRDGHDGFMDEVPALREVYGADLVCLFAGYANDNTIGLGYIMRDPSASDNADRGFTEVCMGTADGPDYTLAHELGHNFGAQHDLAHADSPGVFSDSYGYRYLGSHGVWYHDIMSYDSAPGDVTIPFYSNPDIGYAGGRTGQAGSSNVARTINATAPVVANYRPTVLPLVTATQTSVLPTGTIYSDYPVTLKAKVKELSANPNSPEGLVTFLDGNAVLGTGTLHNGKAKWTGSLAIGTTHAIRALYQNDDYFGDSISAAIPLAATRLRIAEHAARGTVVGSAASMAVAGQTLSYAITGGNPDDVFAIDNSSGVIRVAHPGRLDYELAGSYRLQVTASDIASTMTGTARVVVNLIDVNEAPSDLALTNYTVMQHLPAGAVVGKLIGTDPDALRTLTYTLVGGAGSRDDAKFTILNGKLRTKSVFDYATKSVYKVRLRVTDQAGLWYEKPMTISVTQ